MKRQFLIFQNPKNDKSGFPYRPDGSRSKLTRIMANCLGNIITNAKKPLSLKKAIKEKRNYRPSSELSVF